MAPTMYRSSYQPMRSLTTLALTLLGLLFHKVSAQFDYTGKIDVEAVKYTGLNGTALQGYMSMPSGTKAAAGSLPAVIIIPDWDGVNEYEQLRATLVAQEWGYVGFAADIYGADKQQVEDDERGMLAGMYRGDPDLFMSRIENAIAVVKNMTEVDDERVALVGYCFGGTGKSGLVAHELRSISLKISLSRQLCFNLG
jgi:cephalosporin-C deacetylase-like acetyl esterase